jgi:hypothetical protein
VQSAGDVIALIAEIAFAAGFRDISHFNRLFKRSNGAPPPRVSSHRDLKRRMITAVRRSAQAKTTQSPHFLGSSSLEVLDLAYGAGGTPHIAGMSLKDTITIVMSAAVVFGSYGAIVEWMLHLESTLF